MEKPTQEYLKTLLDYNPETGIIIWICRRPKVKQFTEAGTKRVDGYRRINIDGKLYYSHTIALFIHTGVWYDLIDHKNRIPDDNRIINIIPSDKSKNAKNSKLPSNSTSGHKGVHFFKRDKTWQVKISHMGKSYHIGYFNNMQDAIEARKQAEIKHWQI